MADDFQKVLIAKREFARFLADEKKDASQDSIEAFAIRMTKANTEKWAGFTELELIKALGGQRPFGYDGL